MCHQIIYDNVNVISATKPSPATSSAKCGISPRKHREISIETRIAINSNASATPIVYVIKLGNGECMLGGGATIMASYPRIAHGKYGIVKSLLRRRARPKRGVRIRAHHRNQHHRRSIIRRRRGRSAGVAADLRPAKSKWQKPAASYLKCIENSRR